MTNPEYWLDALWRASWQGALLVFAVLLIFRVAKNIPSGVRSWIWPLVLTKFVLTLVVVWELPVLAPLVPEYSIFVDPSVLGESKPVAPTAPIVQYGLLSLWMTGVLVISARAFLDHVRLRKLASRARDASDRVIASVQELAGQYGITRPMSVKTHVDATVPLVFGITKPTILLPHDIETRFSEEELKMVLAHELAHVHRKDVLTGVYVFVCQTLFFFHPSAWAAKHEWQYAREAACDLFAIERTGTTRRQYADMLIKVSTGAKRTPAFALSAVPAYKTLQRRINEMKNERQQTWKARTTWVVVAAFVSAAALPVSFTHRKFDINGARDTVSLQNRTDVNGFDFRQQQPNKRIRLKGYLPAPGGVYDWNPSRIRLMEDIPEPSGVYEWIPSDTLESGIYAPITATDVVDGTVTDVVDGTATDVSDGFSDSIEIGVQDSAFKGQDFTQPEIASFVFEVDYSQDGKSKWVEQEYKKWVELRLLDWIERDFTYEWVEQKADKWVELRLIDWTEQDPPLEWAQLELDLRMEEEFSFEWVQLRLCDKTAGGKYSFEWSEIDSKVQSANRRSFSINTGWTG